MALFHIVNSLTGVTDLRRSIWQMTVSELSRERQNAARPCLLILLSTVAKWE